MKTSSDERSGAAEVAVEPEPPPSGAQGILGFAPQADQRPRHPDRRVHRPVGDVRLPPRCRGEPVPGRRRGDRRRRRRRVLPLLGHEPRGGVPAGSLSGRRAALRVRRPRAGHPDGVPDLPGDQHDPRQLQGLERRGLRRLRQLQVRLHRPEHAPRDPEHVRMDRHRAAPRRVHRTRVRDAGRPAPPGRGRGQVDDLPADGDLVRRRLDHLEVDLQLSARRDSDRTSDC